MSKRHKLDDATYKSIQMLSPEEKTALRVITQHYFLGVGDNPEDVVSWIERLAQISDGMLLAKILSYLSISELALMCRISKFINAVCIRYKMTLRIVAGRVFVSNNKLDTLSMISIRAIKMITCGSYHAIALDNNGNTFAWGLSEYGMLGDGNIERHLIHPDNAHAMRYLDTDKIVFVASSNVHSVYVAHSGIVFACGYGYGGILGDGNVGDHNVGTPIRMLVDAVVVSAACSETHTVLIANNGEVFVCGYSNTGVLGIDGGAVNEMKIIGVPTKLQLDEFVVSASCSTTRTVLVTKNGNAYVCGDMFQGGSWDRVYINIPTKVEFDDPNVFVVSSATSFKHTVFVAKDGRVFAHGISQSGALGFGPEKLNAKTPFPMILPLDVSIKMAACFAIPFIGEMTILVAKDGRVFVCGADWHKLAKIDVSNRFFTPEPIIINFPIEFVAIEGSNNVYFIATAATLENGFLPIACNVCKLNEIQYVDREDLIGVCGSECWERRQALRGRFAPAERTPSVGGSRPSAGSRDGLRSN